MHQNEGERNPSLSNANEDTEIMEDNEARHSTGSGLESGDRADHRETRSQEAEADLVDSSVEAQKLENELKIAQEKLLRQAAEFQNYKRRMEAELTSSIRYGNVQVLLVMLDVYDDLARSMEAARAVAGQEGDEGAFKSLYRGVELVYQKFEDSLGKFGVEPIDAVGQPFNENEHEAMMQQPAPEEVTPGTVIGEVQKGYKVGGKVLRHAKVIVAQ